MAQLRSITARIKRTSVVSASVRAYASNRLRRGLAIAGACLVMAGLPGASVGQTFLDLTDQSPPYRLFLPTALNPAAAAPLVVMLHGCRQDSQAFADVTRMNAIAADRGFDVVYPEQTAHPRDCWHWYESAHQQRGQGEPAAIMAIVDAVKARPGVAIDDDRIYVAGLSAGAAMTAILAATYPDVFAAIGMAAGVPYRAADGCLSAFNATQRILERMFTGDALDAWADYWSAYGTCLWAAAFNPLLSSVPDPDTLGAQAFAAMGAAQRVVPAVVIQGLADQTVVADNGHDMVSQWAQANDLAADGVDDDNIDDLAETENQNVAPGGHSYVERIYEDDRGNVVIQSYMIEDMDHAWPGGAANLDYSDPAGPDASALLWEFFDAHPMTTIPSAAPFGFRRLPTV